MSYDHLSIISFGYFEKDILDVISRDVYREFLYPVKVKEGHLDLSEFYDAKRRQYDGNKLLVKVDDQFSSESLKTFGLFNVDLFIPILTYIFGQAYLNGRTGIASIYRLSNERYGLKMDEQRLVERLSKEVIHEFGHTFGLTHCHHPACVMRSSTYVEDIDQKSANLCAKCRNELGLE